MLCNREVVCASSLSVLGTPVKVGIRVGFACSGPSFRPCLGWWSRSRGRGGAPGAQRGRTTSRLARSPPHTRWPGDEAKTRVVQVICCLPERAGDVHVVARAGAQPYLGPRTRVRRHDDGWGARRAGRRRGAAAHSFREVHPAAGWRQERCGSRPRASAEVWAGHVRNAWLGGHLLAFGDG
jgi:hypothetical protein